MKNVLNIFLLFFSLSICSNMQALTTPQSQMEKLDRGVVAIKNGNNTFVSWRLLGTDDENVIFNLLRDGSKVASGLRVTNYTDTKGTDASQYQVETVLDGKVIETSTAVQRWGDIFKSIKLDRPVSTNAAYHYFPNDVSVGDVDGDGLYELIVKWDPSNAKDNETNGYTGKVFLDCYRLDGTKLWRIDMGWNIRAGAHYTQFLVYDFNGDGKAELICKTAPGTLDGTNQYVTVAATDATIKNEKNTTTYINSKGRVLTGPEYLTVFDGLTGRAIHTVWYNPNRGFGVGSSATMSELWGDDYGNRCDRFLAGVAYLDGVDKNPSAVMCRGYYTRSYLWAVDFDGKELKTKWLHGSVSASKVEHTDANGTKEERTYNSNTAPAGVKTSSCTAYGQGCHSLTIGDCDGDGCDEIVYGGATVDHDGWILHSTGLDHGDALHLSDMMPDRPGLEVMMVHEHAPFGFHVRDAQTGEILVYQKGLVDTGRGIAADVSKKNRGFEFWCSGDFDLNKEDDKQGPKNIYNIQNEVIAHYTTDYPFYNFRMYWDGDAYDDLFDKGAIQQGNEGIGSRLLTCGNYAGSATYGTKANPQLLADLFGDWREEVILFDKTDSCTLNIFSTTTATKLRVPTLMHDHVYRMAIAWQNVGYNQPPHLGYYLPDYVAARLEPVAGSSKEVTSSVDKEIEMTFRLVNCTSCTIGDSYLNDEYLTGYVAPDGFDFKVDTKAGTCTLKGTPTVVGEYKIVIDIPARLADDGTAVSDTLHLHVTNSSGIESMKEAPMVMDRNVYDLQGRRVEQLRKGAVYVVRRGQKTVKMIAK